jgi:hypothetical protein
MGDDDGAAQLRRRQRALTLLQRGAELTAPIAGGMVGLLGGPPGVLAGTTVGLAIREAIVRLGDEFEQRQLGPREKTRAGAALYWALTEVEERLEDGQTPRSDDFFPGEDSGRRARADELLEAVLTRAMHDHEEQKLRHLGVMYGALVFREDVEPGHANFLVELASRLTWEQLVLIELVHGTSYRNLPDWRRFNPYDLKAHGVAGQLFDLARLGILVRTDARPVSDISDMNPTYLQAATTGCLLRELMRLEEIDVEVLAEAFEELQVIADEPLDPEVAARIDTTFDSERVTDEDLDACRVRLRVTPENVRLLPPTGTTFEGVFRGSPITFTVSKTDVPDVIALVPASEDREEFYATLDARQVLRVSKVADAELWLD